MSKFIDLTSIEKLTGLRTIEVKKQLYCEALANLKWAKNNSILDKNMIFQLDIVGYKNTYAQDCRGIHSLEFIVNYFDRIEEKLAEQHEAQIDARLAEINRQREDIGNRGKQAQIAQKALNIPEAAALDKVGFPPRPYSAGAALAKMRPRSIKNCVMCNVLYVGYDGPNGCCSNRCVKRKSRLEHGSR